MVTSVETGRHARDPREPNFSHCDSCRRAVLAVVLAVTALIVAACGTERTPKREPILHVSSGMVEVARRRATGDGVPRDEAVVWDSDGGRIAAQLGAHMRQWKITRTTLGPGRNIAVGPWGARFIKSSDYSSYLLRVGNSYFALRLVRSQRLPDAHGRAAKALGFRTLLCSRFAVRTLHHVGGYASTVLQRPTRMSGLNVAACGGSPWLAIWRPGTKSSTQVRFWNAFTGRRGPVSMRIRGNKHRWAVAVTGGNRPAFAWLNDGSAIHIISLKKGKKPAPARVVRLGGGPLTMGTFSPASREFFAITGAWRPPLGKLGVIAVRRGTRHIRSVTLPGRAVPIAPPVLSADGRLLAFATISQSASTIWILNCRTLRPVYTARLITAPHVRHDIFASCAFSPHHHRLAILSARSLWIVRLETPSPPPQHIHVQTTRLKKRASW